MRHRLVITLVIAALAAAVLVPSAGAATRVMGVCDNYLVRGSDCGANPLTLNRIFVIKKRDYVRWTWRGEDTHRMFVRKLGYDSGERTTGATFKRRFKKTGKFHVLCTIHPDQETYIRVRG